MSALWEFCRDLRFAIRGYRRKPGAAITITLLLAMGIGAATSVFSFVDRVLFCSLPYRKPNQLISLGIRIPWLEYDFLTAASYSELRRRPEPLTSVTSWAGVSDCDVDDGRPLRLACARVEYTFLPVLGIEPAAGRNFTKDDDRDTAPRVALISHALWKSRFGGAGDAVGRRIDLDGKPATIVGVLPEDFELPTLDRADVPVPLALRTDVPPGGMLLRIYGRVRQDVPIPRAREALLARENELLGDVPPFLRKQVGFHVTDLRELQSGSFRSASWMLFAAVLAMLAIACANAANLILARAIARRNEMAIRVALGASRARLAGQAIAETLPLSVAGGAAGCIVAAALLRVFVVIAPAGIPYLSAAALDRRVLSMGIAAALFCGALFGLAPAVQRVPPELGAGTRTTGPASLFARRALVGAQLAISFVLLACAGILLQSLWNREAVSLGLRANSVVTGQVVLGSRYGQPAARALFYEQIEQRIAKLPGVESVALTDSLPPGGVPRSQPAFAPRVDGRPPVEPNVPRIVVWRAVTPGYFRTLGIPIVRGRAFVEQDQGSAERPVILSASYARFLFGDGEPVGRHFARAPGAAHNPSDWFTIVGIAADVQNAGLTDRNDYEYYLVRRRGSAAPEDTPGASAILVRPRTGAGRLGALLRSQVAALDAGLPVAIRTFEEHTAELAARPRFQASLLASFAAIGLLLAVFGLYGLVSFLIAQRQREFGVRMALGARPADIGKAVVAEALRWSIAGLALGLAGAAVAARSMRSLLFHVSPGHPAAYGIAGALLLGPSLVAALLPAWRAARMDPMATLRRE